MCAILGAIYWNVTSEKESGILDFWLATMIDRAHERGRDGRGYVVNNSNDIFPRSYIDATRLEPEYGYLDSLKQRRIVNPGCEVGTFIANVRAEPTTEYVKDKKQGDQQPYTVHPWSIVHNGTIANDKELRTHALDTTIDSAAIVERLHQKGEGVDIQYGFELLRETAQELKGSYAIITSHSQLKNSLFLACNYRPIWYVLCPMGIFFASCKSYLPEVGVPQMIEPYSVCSVSYDLETKGLKWAQESLINKDGNGRALVVCSGGLDSVVAATHAQSVGVDIELLHFTYGSRAEGPEVAAVVEIAEFLNVPYRIMSLPIYKPGDSPLLQADSGIAGGEEGAEFAHEWVPARNIVMLSIATALAEAGNFGHVILGNNLEEAGAYPDNEPEFIKRFNEVLPFAVGDGKRVQVAMPVGNLMKHEIVALGLKIGAPLHLTWSCYRAGDKHCGKCGPCFMRRTAFEINDAEEVITYQE